MRMPDTIQVFEYDTLRVGERGFSHDHFTRLAIYQEQRQSPFFSLGHNTIRFSNFVGVFQVHDLVIEVLPKAGRDDNAELWRSVLIDMLKISGFLNIRTVSESSLTLRGGNLLNFFFGIYLASCTAIINEGLVRRYRPEQQNRTALKGRLLFNEQLRKNLVRKDRFFTHSQEFTVDNIYNQILFKALRIISSLSTSSAQRRDAVFLLEHNEAISDIHCTQDTFLRLRYERSTERYRTALRLAELIILNHQPDLRGGLRSVFAILFPMEALFEAYVTQLLLSASRKTSSVEVMPQRSTAFWRMEGQRARTVRPDIILKCKESKKLIILDTKWKVPNKNVLPASSDLQQMFVYNKLFGAASSNLVYPETRPTMSKPGTFLGGDHGACSLWFVPIIDPIEKRLNTALGTTMLARLTEE